MGIVVLPGTAFMAIFTLFNNSDLGQINFMMCITSFLCKSGFIYKIMLRNPQS